MNRLKVVDRLQDRRGFGFSFQPLEGYGYGLRQRILVGKISLTARAQERLIIAIEKVAPFLETILTEANPFEPGGANQAKEALDLYFKVQQYAKIPVFPEYVIRSIGIENKTASFSQQAWSCNLVLPYWRLEASKLVLDWISNIANYEAWQQENLKNLLEKIRPYSLGGTNAYPFVKAGWDLSIYYNVVHDRTIQFGLGMQSRWLDSSLTDQASFLSIRLAKDKRATNTLLTRLGFPTTRQILVRNAEEAMTAKKRLGRTIVLKPVGQDQGQGVSIDLKEDDDIRHAYDLAAQYGTGVIAEAYVRGRDYRLITFRDSVVKCILREPLSVTGDGIKTVAELLRIKSEQPEYVRETSVSGKNPFVIDGEMIRVLKETGLDSNSIPSHGDVIVLRKIANISAGGSQTLVEPSDIHPDNALLAIAASEALRLDICGIDLMIDDISKSWQDIGGTIIEINAQPQIGVRLLPKAYTAILRNLISFQPLQVLLVVFPSEITKLTPEDEIIARVFQNMTSPVFMASTNELWQDKKCVLKSDDRGFQMIYAALQNPRAASLMFLLTRDEVCKFGLPTHQLERIYFVLDQYENNVCDGILTQVRLLAADIPIIEISR